MKQSSPEVICISQTASSPDAVESSWPSKDLVTNSRLAGWQPFVLKDDDDSGRFFDLSYVNRLLGYSLDVNITKSAWVQEYERYHCWLTMTKGNFTVDRKFP